MIGIQSALEIEIERVREHMTGTRAERRGGMEFAVGGIGSGKVVAVAGGVGTARAASCAQALIDLYHVESIILCGVAGRVNPRLKVGEILISRDAVQCGCGVHASRIRADENLVRLAQEACAKTAGTASYVTGTVLTVERAVLARKRRIRLLQEYAADCVEMEGAAVGAVCARNSVPFVVLRAISDRAGPLALFELRKNLRSGSRRVQEVVLELLSLLAE